MIFYWRCLSSPSFSEFIQDAGTLKKLSGQLVSVNSGISIYRSISILVQIVIIPGFPLQISLRFSNPVSQHEVYNLWISYLFTLFIWQLPSTCFSSIILLTCHQKLRQPAINRSIVTSEGLVKHSIVTSEIRSIYHNNVTIGNMKLFVNTLPITVMTPIPRTFGTNYFPKYFLPNDLIY